MPELINEALNKLNQISVSGIKNNLLVIEIARLLDQARNMTVEKSSETEEVE